MKISELIAELKQVKKLHDDIQTTCTHVYNTNVVENVIETTIENLVVHEHPTIGPCVRVWL